MDTDTPKVDTLERRLHEARRCQWEMERAMLVADRDSWCEQAEQRTADAVEAFARAERAERENARLRYALKELVEQCKTGDDITAWWRVAVDNAESALASMPDTKLSQPSKCSSALLGSVFLLDNDGAEVRHGDRIGFSYGIPPIGVCAQVVQRGKSLLALTPGHTSTECNLRSLRRYVGEWFRLPNAQGVPDGCLAQSVRKHDL